MVQFMPLSGFRYDLGQVGALSEVVCPLPGTIDETLQDELYQLHPCNAVRLVCNREEPGDSGPADRFARACDFFQLWKQEGILIQEHEATAYVCQQTWQQNGEECSSLSVIGRVYLDDSGDDGLRQIVEVNEDLLHERLELLRSGRCQLFPVHGLICPGASAGESAVLADILPQLHAVTPLLFRHEAGMTYRVWPVTDRGLLQVMQQHLSQHAVVVIEETEQWLAARRYHAEQQAAGCEGVHDESCHSILICLTEFGDAGNAVDGIQARPALMTIPASPDRTAVEQLTTQ